MFYIVVLHVLKQGGVLENTIGISNDIAWLIEIITYCAVDIYAIISGYVGYADEFKAFKAHKYISVWMPVFFYSFGITLIAFIIIPQAIGFKTLVQAFFPVATSQYWYFTAFTGVFLLKPWLNRFVRNLSKNELTTFSMLVLILFSTYSVFASRIGGDPFVLNEGKSVLWLLLLYIVGAWIKKCNVAAIISSKIALLVIAGCALFTWLGRQYLPSSIGFSLLVSYLSPTVVLSAIAYLVVFSKMHLSCITSKIIAFFAPAAFGVYLIHVQPILRDRYLKGAFVWICDFTAWLLPLLIVGSALVFFIVCIVVEKLRQFIFEAIKINKITRIIGNKIDDFFLKVQDKEERFLGEKSQGE